jgi:hypothetical protein
VIAGNGDDGLAGTPGGHAKRIVIALNDEGRDLDRIQLVLARLIGLAWWMLGEREAEDRGCASLGGGSARHPRAERAPARDQRHRITEALAQCGYGRGPGLVRPRGSRRRLAPGNYVGLFDKRGSEAELPGLELGTNEVRSPHPTPGTMAEHEEALRGVRLFQVGPRWAMERLNLDRVHDA